MVAYFRKMNLISMIAGALFGAVIGLLAFRGKVFSADDPIRMFFFGMFIAAGIVVGRAAAAFMANRRLRSLYAILYQESDPAQFIERFTPLLEQVPHDLAEYVQGCCHVAFAKGALGDFDGALFTLKDLHPESLRLHSLTATSLLINQRCSLYLQKKDSESASAMIRDLASLSESAQKRASTLAENLSQCIRLQTARLKAIAGEADADTAYLEEEIRLATNAIHRKQIQLELADYYRRTGRASDASVLLQGILKERKGLYSEDIAEKMMDEV